MTPPTTQALTDEARRDLLSTMVLIRGSSLFRVGGLVDLEPCCDRFRWCRRAG